MSLAGEKKWLVTRYPEAPGKLIVLGSILTDRNDPESSLNRKTGVVPIPAEDRRDQSIALQRSVHSQLSKDFDALLKGNPLASPLFSAGWNLQSHLKNSVEYTIEAMNVRAEVFTPTKKYMDEASAMPEVVEYVKKGLFAKSLYIIVGVATAGRISVADSESRERTAMAGAHANVVGTGAEFAAELSGGHKDGLKSELRIEEECDFAYRVREFVYSKFFRGSRRDKGNRTDGAMFGAKEDKYDGNANEDQDEDVIPVFEYFEDEEDDVEPSGTLLLTVAED